MASGNQPSTATAAAAAAAVVELTDLQKQIFEKITNKDVGGLKTLLTQLTTPIDFIDENGMTPLQHACYKQCTEAVQCILDQGADVNLNKHATKYSALHFAALSGSTDICRLLLAAGADTQATNSVSRNPAQMAAFVGNHAAVATINNYVPKSALEPYLANGDGDTASSASRLPVYLLDALHAFACQTNMHPVRIALNLQKCPAIAGHLGELRAVLRQMTERDMQRQGGEINEIAAFKYHYLGWIVGEIIKCREHFSARKGDAAGAEATTDAAKATADYLELFAKRVLKENRAGQLDYVESTIRECVREFPHRECTIFRQIVTQLAGKDAAAALDVVRASVNGQRGFVDETTYCSTCGDEKPDKKCSKCKAVQYCDRECQRLHWFMHKKTCARPTSNTAATAKKEIDVAEISEQLQNLVAG